MRKMKGRDSTTRLRAYIPLLRLQCSEKLWMCPCGLCVCSLPALSLWGATSYGYYRALETWLVKTEMRSKYKTHTGLPRLRMKNRM